jgi:hypothetical protein
LSQKYSNDGRTETYPMMIRTIPTRKPKSTTAQVVADAESAIMG